MLLLRNEFKLAYSELLFFNPHKTRPAALHPGLDQHSTMIRPALHSGLYQHSTMFIIIIVLGNLHYSTTCVAKHVLKGKLTKAPQGIPPQYVRSADSTQPVGEYPSGLPFVQFVCTCGVHAPRHSLFLYKRLVSYNSTYNHI